ncbi:NEDD8-specific protease 1 [Striga hermonthica]|uniref:NEDD8-specific protease 1 n=1 Tax=Striga hermonthica TaxID=68872 RepID=A0A9N7MQE8_STRHE|nr:NEDD8-specific protease 1 [Striga hermonthica]
METAKNPDDKILSYNDVVLRRSDLEILSGPHFLNDRIIEFYFSHLGTRFPNKEVLLVPPSIAFWIKECPDNNDLLRDFLKPLNLHTRKLIIFPVNDNADVELAGGGSHWSLLAFVRRRCSGGDGVFVHHDSYGSHNGEHARRVYLAVRRHVVGEEEEEARVAAAYVERPIEPGQTNGYDCGVYVAAVAEAICEWWWCHAGVGPAGGGKEDGLWFRELDEKVKQSRVSRMRGEILELVREMMAER